MVFTRKDGDFQGRTVSFREGRPRARGFFLASPAMLQPGQLVERYHASAWLLHHRRPFSTRIFLRRLGGIVFGVIFHGTYFLGGNTLDATMQMLLVILRGFPRKKVHEFWVGFI